MPALKSLYSRLLLCTRGATAVEYGLILAMIVLAVIAALSELASTTTVMWNDVSEQVQSAR